MPQFNFYILFLAALIPLLIGSVYYNPKVLGRAWMQAAGITNEQAMSRKPIVTFGLTYLFSLLLAYILGLFTIHQSSIFQLFLHDPGLAEAGTEVNTVITDFMSKYGDRHRTFGHGVIHGIEFSLFTGFAMIGINTLFEGRPMKYMWIHLVFWLICGALMGGVLCAFV